MQAFPKRKSDSTVSEYFVDQKRGDVEDVAGLEWG
jgi:hypothetical protein